MAGEKALFKTINGTLLLKSYARRDPDGSDGGDDEMRGFSKGYLRDIYHDTYGSVVLHRTEGL